ncbi:hypothetical protein [uncultured Litoreibacter sp.]|uniref:hypothetical protein n=1 Tax=uncultured Litoreibacter sp. TaxID=1392394 RepID=UPI00260CBC15|nr:hypothetical protein [uncultured Litoreibacter sp.]
MFTKKIAVAIVGMSLLASPAVAGNTTMKNDAGDKIRIACKDSGCTVKSKKSDAKKYGLVEKTKGGVDTFKALEAKYQGLGYK